MHYEYADDVDDDDDMPTTYACMQSHCQQCNVGCSNFQDCGHGPISDLRYRYVTYTAVYVSKLGMPYLRLHALSIIILFNAVSALDIHLLSHLLVHLSHHLSLLSICFISARCERGICCGPVSSLCLSVCLSVTTGSYIKKAKCIRK